MYNNKSHPQKRRKIHLPDYDYSQPGYYFVTVCSKDKQHLFGEIRDGIMAQSFAGETVRKQWFVLQDLFGNIRLHDFVVMPNHVHGIIEIANQVDSVTLGSIVKRFKAGSSYNAGVLLWQKGFYEHVIRSEREYYSIVEYIRENVVKWDLDCYF